MRIAVLTSGGVDSSVALATLAQAGHDVHAFYLKVWLEDELEHLGDCPWEEDLRYARAVAGQFGVPLTVIPLQRAYREGVVAYLLEELERGGTPSPDLFCNSRIKFGAFPDWVDAEVPGRRFERVATGHYARRVETADGVELHRAPDPVKDQTYFLSRIGARQLDRAMFPVGDLRKAEVRALAAGRGLAPRDRPDSQGICFLGNVRYRDFVAAHLGERAGPVVDEATGEQLGTHRGHWLFTIGQRRGLGLSGGPWYVSGKEPAANRVLVRRGAGRAREPLPVRGPSLDRGRRVLRLGTPPRPGAARTGTGPGAGVVERDRGRGGRARPAGRGPRSGSVRRPLPGYPLPRIGTHPGRDGRRTPPLTARHPPVSSPELLKQTSASALHGSKQTPVCYHALGLRLRPPSPEWTASNSRCSTTGWRGHCGNR